MQFLEKNQYFPDFHYHRTASAVYRKYLESCGPETYTLGKGPQYGWKKRALGIYIVKHERIDTEPDIESLKNQHGIKHAFVVWVPNTRTDISPDWKKLWLSSHFQETGFTVVDTPDYKKKWNDRARRAEKKFLSSGGEIRLVTQEEFVDAFRKTKVKHWYKSDYISYYKRLASFDPSSIRQWLCYRDGKPVAGLAVHDYCENSSVHLVAFTGKDAYPIQGGTGLIAEWFADSYKKGLKYLSFDQLRQKGGPKDQKGYTEFKESFIEYRMSYPNAYFKIF